MIAIGLQDASLPPGALVDKARSAGMTWTRFITTTRDDHASVAARIRAAHAGGLRVVLTVGGIGTDGPDHPVGGERRPAVAATLRWITSLPAADRYTWVNEADIEGIQPCVYRRGWMKLRTVLGRRLMFGDTSPRWTHRFTEQAAACGPLPASVEFAVHPYQESDPLAPPRPDTRWAENEGGVGRLGALARTLRRRLALRVRWAFDEFGYLSEIADERAAWLWPRFLRRADDLHATMAIAYMARGRTWDSTIGPLAWAALANKNVPTE